MGHIRVRKETGKLYFDFTYQNLRCREQTDLLDTPANRKKLEAMLARITAEITLGQFDYATYFPNSKRLDKLKAIEIKRSKHIRGMPCFGEFVESWYDEMESSWRRTYQITISSIIRIHLIVILKYPDELSYRINRLNWKEKTQYLHKYSV
ncbi:MAG: DUF3596 domain-containing protein [Marinicella sp.]